MSELGSPFGQGWPDRFNLCTYFLDHNVDEGRGEKTALVCGDRSHTYASLQERVIRLTAALREMGLGAEDRVLIVLPDDLEFAEIWFATLRAGGVFAMVNPLLKAKDFSYELPSASPANILVIPATFALAGILVSVAIFIHRRRSNRYKQFENENESMANISVSVDLVNCD